MKNIVEKSKKDLKRAASRPVIGDIITLKGFIRYFAYRTTMPFVRDVLFFIFDTAQIFLIFKLLGFKASSGGMLGYAFVIFVSGFWNTLVYSMRKKVLELDSKKQHNLITNYFSPLVLSGGIIWIVAVTLSIMAFGQFGSDSSIIFISRVLSHGIDLYSTIYFFTVYSLTRVYIPFSIMVLNRVVFLALPLFLIRYIGVWSFTVSFFLERLFSLWLTVRCSNKSLKARGINSICSDFILFAPKKMFWFVKEGLGSFIKRATSFSLLNFQRLLFLILVSRYYYSYLLDFFAFYQLMHVFFLVPQRIGRSLYYDVTMLLNRGRYHLMRLLCNYDIVVALLLGVVAIFIFDLLSFKVFPAKFTSIMVELAILGKWGSIYMLLFFSFGIMVIQRILIVSEAHCSFIFTVVIFDYLLLAFMIISSPYFLRLGDPIFIFSIQGNLSLYYFLALLIIYLSGIWKKESIIYSARAKDTRVDFFTKIQEHPNGVVVALFLSKKYRRSPVVESAHDVLKVFSSIKVTRDVVLIYADTESDIYEQHLNVISRLGIYCDQVVFSLPKDFSKRIKQVLSQEKFIYEGKPSLAFAKDYLDRLEISYQMHPVSYLSGSKRKKQLYELLGSLQPDSLFIPEHLVFKKDYLGIIPIIEHGKIDSFLDVNTTDINLLKGLVRDLSLNEFYCLALKISNG